jgi:SAM-dependent methyltransferase
MGIRDRVSLGSILEIATRPSALLKLPRFIRDLLRYRSLERRPLARLRLYPCLTDALPNQTVHSAYFLQDTWAAKQVFRESPDWLVDVGSTTLLVGILSQYVRTISVDIRPIQAALDGLETRRGSVLSLPFADGEVPCLTTMCVLEHIGLGRYGDPIDPAGTEKAVREIARVIRPGGLVVYSVPVGTHLLEFNAHRRFEMDEAVALFDGWHLVDKLVIGAEAGSGRGTSADCVACFAMRKPPGSEE